MDFVGLRHEIQSRANIDVTPHLERFRQTSPKGTPDAFLAHLHQEGVIDVRLFKELHTTDDVDATSTIADVIRRTRPGAKGTLIMDDPNATKVEDMTLASAADADRPHDEDDGEGDNVEVYEVLGELGKGAMGEVHLARDLVLRRKVAMKSILPQMQENQSLFGRFLGEMQITAQLDHPYIVPIYGVDTGPSGGLAYAMKLVQGRELEELIDETKALIQAGKPLGDTHSLEARLEAFLKVCDAMAYAHERGVIHRDLKPANVMLGKYNDVYVMDWGIARLMGKRGTPQDAGVELYDAEGNDATEMQRTRLGSTIGTPIYMSPEQAAGKNDELDGRSDLYSLGLILQEMVTLTRANAGTTLQEVLTNAKDGRRIPPMPPAPGSEVPREIRAIIEKATRVRPEDRYATVTEFADDIRRFLRNEAILAEPDTGAQRLGRWISKNRMTAAAIILLTLLTGAGATIGVLVYNHFQLEAQHNRELQLAQLQASSAVRAQELDATFQRYEKLLTRMVGAASHALSRANGDDQLPLHPSSHFEPGPSAVSGLMKSSHYGTHVSFDWPVTASAPSAAASKSDLASIDALRSVAKGIMLESLGPDGRKLSDEDRIRALAETGVPVRKISLTLESGLHADYPGTAGLADDHDGRKAPLYGRAKNGSGIIWGPPTEQNGKMVLECATAVRDDSGDVLGVLTFQIDPALAVAAAIESGKAEHIETSMLVERTGRVIAQNARDESAKEPEVLSLDTVLEAIKNGETGYVETQRGGRDVLVTFHPLSSVDWYLVTVADVQKVERSAPTEGARPGSVAAATPPTAVATAAPAPKPSAPPEPTPEPTAEPSAEPSAEPEASAAPSASAPKLWGTLPTAAPTAEPAPPATDAPPPNPFEPWKAYDDKDQKP